MRNIITVKTLQHLSKEELVKLIALQQENADEGRSLALEWNNTTRGSPEDVLLQKRNLAEMFLNFVEAIEEEVGPKQFGGGLADNKIGIHVGKRLKDTTYVDGFNQRSGTKYAELREHTTFGQDGLVFTWAIPLGTTEDLEVVPDTLSWANSAASRQ